MTVPYISNRSPIPNTPDADASVTISFDIFDTDGDLTKSGIFVYINGTLAFEGYDAYDALDIDGYFHYPYDTPTSTFTTTSVGGIDGYHLYIDSYNTYSGVTSVRVIACDLASNQIDGYWAFVIEEKVNSLYFCDGYGLKRIDVRDLVGEAQSAKASTATDLYQPYYTKVRTVLSTTTNPSISGNQIGSIFSNLVDGYLQLVLSYDNYGGISMCGNEVIIRRYADGYSTHNGQITDDGTLYLINKDTNSIYVYYGANFRNGYRQPDFIYSSTSTPSIVAGEILDLHVVSGESTRKHGRTRLYVGTSLGATRVETYDLDNDGYCAGYDGYGVSIHYGISGSGLQHEIIGGTIARVVGISSDDDRNVMFIATSNGINGGVTQVAISSSRQLVYMTYGSGTFRLPSGNIRDIFGTGL